MPRYLIYISVLISILLHIILYHFLVNFDYKLEFKEKEVYNVSFIKSKEQYVNTRFSNSNKIKNTPFKSDKTTSVKEQTVKRGQGGSLPKTIVGKKSLPKKTIVHKKTSEVKKSITKKEATKKTITKKLDLSPINKVLDSITKNELVKNKKKSSTSAPLISQPFSRGAGQSAAISGFSSGSIDYLPSIKDGDITFLNAKADKFAVFVRRVAIRVFQYLKQTGWETLSASQVRAISSWVRIIAAINLKGDLVEIKILTPSGSTFFDRVAKESVASGVVDPNPPPSAVAVDGNIRFIFYARSWSEIAGGPGRVRGRFGERRWLGLKAGLE